MTPLRMLRLSLLTSLIAIALPLAAAAVATNVSVNQGNAPVKGAKVTILDTSGAKVAEADTDENGVAHFDLAPGQNYTAQSGGETSAPFGAGESPRIGLPGSSPERAPGGFGAPIISLDLGGGGTFADGSSSASGHVTTVDRQEQRLGPFFDSPIFVFEQEQRDGFSFGGGSGPSGGVGFVGLRVDVPCGHLPHDGNTFLSFGSPLGNTKETLSGNSSGKRFNFLAETDLSLVGAVGAQFPIFDNGRHNLNVEGGLAWGYTEVDLSGWINPFASKTLDTWYLGPSIGLNTKVWENDKIQVGLFATANFLLPISGKETSLTVGNPQTTGARIEYSVDTLYQVFGGIRIGFKVN